MSKYGKCIKYRLLSWRQTFGGTCSLCPQSKKSALTIFKKVCCSARDANLRPWVYSTKVKSIVARYPLHYWDINNWWWIFSQVRKLMCIGHYRHFVFSTWKVHCAVVLCAPLWLGLHYWQWEMYTVTRHTRKFYFILMF